MSNRTNNQAKHVPPYYYFSENEEQRLQALWNKKTGSKRRLRSLLSRRSARR